MTSTTTNITPALGLQDGGGRFFKFLEMVANCSPSYRAVQHYNAMSDAELATRGMTRRDVVERVFGSRMGL